MSKKSVKKQYERIDQTFSNNIIIVQQLLVELDSIKRSLKEMFTKLDELTEVKVLTDATSLSGNYGNFWPVHYTLHPGTATNYLPYNGGVYSNGGFTAASNGNIFHYFYDIEYLKKMNEIIDDNEDNSGDEGDDLPPDEEN